MLETGRLCLRVWREEDLPSLDRILGSAAVMEFSDAGPLNAEAQRAWLSRAREQAQHAPLPGLLAAESCADQTVIGYVGLTKGAGRVADNEAEIGFRLAAEVWGRGLATEAVLGIIGAGREIGELEQIVGIVDPNNRRSIRVLEKVGMHNQGEIMLPGYDYPDHRYVLGLR